MTIFLIYTGRFGLKTRIALSIILIFSMMSSVLAAEAKDKNLPDFTLDNLEGKKISLSDYRGKVVLVNFWATWCMPCLKEMPDLIKLKDKYSEKEFEVLGIVVASKEENVRKTVDNLKVNYPVLWGTKEVIKEFGNINSIPRTFIVDKEGNIVEDISGMRDFDFFEKTVKKYLKIK